MLHPPVRQFASANWRQRQESSDRRLAANQAPPTYEHATTRAGLPIRSRSVPHLTRFGFEMVDSSSASPGDRSAYSSRRVASSGQDDDNGDEYIYAGSRALRSHNLRRRLPSSLDERLGIRPLAGQDESARIVRTTSASASPDGAKTRSPSRRRKVWTVVFFVLQALAALPSFVGFCHAISQSIHTARTQTTVLLNHRKALHPDAIDWLIAAMWAVACAYFSHALARGLMRRWLVYYTVLPTIIRSFSLQAICWPLTLATYRLVTPQRPILMWYICATTAACSVRCLSTTRSPSLTA